MIAAPLLAVLLAAGPTPGTVPQAGQPYRPVSHERPFTVYFGMGIDRGGEEIASISLADGSEETLSANQGFFFTGGIGFLQQRLTPKVQVDTLATIGVKGWDAGGSDGSINYLTFPVDVIERVWFPYVRVGAGFTYLLAPRITTDGVLSSWGDLDLKNTFGFVGQVEWCGHLPGSFQSFGIGVRMVLTELKPQDGGPSIDANSYFGLVLGGEL